VNSSPSIDNGSFAPPSSIQRSDSRNNSKLVLQKDKMIESLRLELAEAQIKLVESQNQGGGRLQEVERLLMEARVANARLMEDNESYQLLLQDRTLKGDFATNDFSYSAGSSANQDALAALEGRSGGTSLADELSGINDNEQDAEAQRRLEAELRSVKDQNKALTLYINKIIERLLQHQGFEHILDQSSDPKGATPNTNKDLPPPPPPKSAPGPSLLQRAKTMAIGTGTGNTTAPRPKPRPMTYMPSSANYASAISNPDTAPSIPIGLNRSGSTRRSRPMSEQYAPGAASIVNAMYKGPSAADGPLSPSLRSSQTFFASGAGNRTSGTASSSGNFPGMRSETSSTSGDSVSLSGTAGADGMSTPPSQSSPPRSLHHHEKNTTFAGNKPRPLRLVQENAEATAAANAAKRQSWVGWAASAFAKKEDGTAAGGAGGPGAGGVGEVIRE
jgi:hypothetical protein